MKEKRLYTCEICHTDYNSQKQALECEKNHCPNINAVEMRFRPHLSLPTTLTVTFANGETATYKH